MSAPAPPLPDADESAAPDTAAPVPAPEPASEPQNTELLQGVDTLRDEVAARSDAVGSVIDLLDAIGFTIADTRFSLLSALVVVLVVLGVFLLARLGERIGRLVLRRIKTLDPSQTLLADKLISVLVWALAILIGIDLLGIDLTALTVFSGAFGLAVGFGLQKTFGNLIAGIILLMDRSIKPGDVIAVSDMAGRESFGQIRQIGIRAISVVTRDMKEYLIPNENLMINQVENWSYSAREVRVKADVGVSYNSDLRLVEKLLMEAVQKPERVLKQPAPRVLLMGFGDSSVDFQIRFWICDPEEGVAGVRSQVLLAVWDLFQEHGIEIPFPQNDLNLRDNEQFQQLVAAISQRVQADKPPEGKA
ncbi:MAG: mechanosensitive ion channel protein [Erythrobacter sp. SCN 62-14]|nr:MAG: mechanosensitive ion channel protein [Erythrobacter sp. SCN 62-14]